MDFAAGSARPQPFQGCLTVSINIDDQGETMTRLRTMVQFLRSVGETSKGVVAVVVGDGCYYSCCVKRSGCTWWCSRRFFWWDL